MCYHMPISIYTGQEAVSVPGKDSRVPGLGMRRCEFFHYICLGIIEKHLKNLIRD